MRRRKALLAVLALTGVSAPACELRIVPGAAWMTEEDMPRGRLGLDLQRTEFRLPEGAGGYWRARVTGVRRLRERWLTGFELPAVRLDDGRGNHAALGSPSLFAERLLAKPGPWLFASGLQLGLPGGGRARGISSDHLELMPYGTVAAHRPRRDDYVFARGGLRASAGGGHERADPLRVDPHEETELVFQAGGGFHVESLCLNPEFFLDGQRALDGHDAGKTFLAAGLFLPFELSDRFELAPYFEGPLSRPKRFQWRSGLRVEFRY